MAWTCPSCGRRFANTNQWHSCLDLDVAAHLDGHSDHAVALFRTIERAVLAAGDVRTHAQRSRIAFIAEMTFAGVRLARRSVDLDLILETWIDDDRIRRLDVYGPTSFGHRIRIETASDVDDDVLAWIGASVRRGRQETLDPGADPEPLPLSLRARTRIPLATRARIGADGQVRFAVPGWVETLLELDPSVVARIRGEERSGAVVAVDGKSMLELGPGGPDLEDGVPVDITLSPA